MTSTPPRSTGDAWAEGETPTTVIPVPDGAGGTHFRFASADEVETRLLRRFPDLPRDVVRDFAEAVSRNKYSYADAKKMLQQLQEFSSVEQAVVAAVEAEKERERRVEDVRLRRYEQEYAEVHRQRSSTSAGERVSHHRPSIPSAMLTSSAAVGTDVLTAGFHANEVLLYMTSMTASRQVRDQCRQLHQLLYLKRIKHTILDIADNPFLQKQLAGRASRQGGGRPSLQTPTPSLPLLFCGENFIGDCDHCQRLEDDGLLLPALESFGFVFVPEPLPTPPAKKDEVDFDEWYANSDRFLE